MAAVISSKPTFFNLSKVIQLSSSPSTCVDLISLPSKKISCNGMSCMTAKSVWGSSRGGSGLLERPPFDQSQFDPTPQAEEGGDIGVVKQKRGTGSGDSYRVLLIDDLHHTEKLVAQVIPRAVPSITSGDAIALFHKSRQDGVAVVIVTVKEHAEFYSQMMIRGGLRSEIEPESDTV